MNRGLRRAWVAVALVTAIAGCTSATRPATDPPVPVFTAGCPELSAPPFGIEATGERTDGQVTLDERKVVGEIVPGAWLDLVICQYPRPSSTRPGIQVDVRAFRGPNGTAHATTFADAEQTRTPELYAEYLPVAATGDNGGFAWYDEPDFCMATHSGNAYVIVAMDPGAGAASEPDMRKALRTQLPALTAVMTTVLDALR